MPESNCDFSGDIWIRMMEDKLFTTKECYVTGCGLRVEIKNGRYICPRHGDLGFRAPDGNEKKDGR